MIIFDKRYLTFVVVGGIVTVVIKVFFRGKKMSQNLKLRSDVMLIPKSQPCLVENQKKIRPGIESLALFISIFVGYHMHWLAVDIMKNSYILASRISILPLEFAYLTLCTIISVLFLSASYLYFFAFDKGKNLFEYFKCRNVQEIRT
ncbi:MAG: hypothetical protein HZB76_05195 [Chlamydiae bacterium]|nr:hypothetical protein [Chlamydiota bacterium]